MTFSVFYSASKRWLGAIVYLLLLAMAAPISAQEITDVIATRDGDYTLRRLVDRLEHPWAIAPLPGGGALLTERPGSMLYLSDLDPGRGRLSTVQNVPDVFAVRQGGMLDVVADPQFEQNDRIYFSYSARAGRGSTTRVATATLEVGANRVALDDVETLFTLNTETSSANHYGSRLAIDAAGYLFITIGDRGQPMSAQNPSNHQGTAIRITTTGSVPRDNPLVDGGGRSEIFSWGHRNAQGIAVHPESGEVWLHEHGPRGGDEINILRRGANYGWPRVTGGVAYSGQVIAESPPPSGMEPPFLEWTPSIAPSGMAFVTGDRYPAWRGDVLVGALAARHLRRVDLSQGSAPRVLGQEQLFTGFGRVRDVRLGPDGYLYLLTDEASGGLYRIESGP